MFQAGSFPVAKRLVNLGYKVILHLSRSTVAQPAP